MGDHIDKLQVDKWALYEIAQYCDVLVPDGYGSIEPRFTINHIITSREEAYKVLNDMASIFRGLAYYSNGLIYAVQDAYKKPVYQFNNANVIEGNFTYSSSAKKTRHSVALVRYIDRRNFFQPSVEYVENEEAIKRYGIRQLETTALGCTSRGQARRFGLWMLASEFQETESLTFSVGQDGGYLKPGDVLQVYDQYRTPLKFGGRTNAVLATGVAPSTLTYGNLPVTGNSIIIDNAINFNDKYYKFSLLTPTYYYDTADVGDNLDSSGINQIRRPQIQDLYFYGPHAQTVTGYYRSDYNVGGSGVATQIYFHTGLLIDGVDPIGTGNQLDFDNYVITGYTNDYVQGSTEVSYSGGCFSGENLIWSLEPNDPADDEFISGNFSTYRIINVAENDDSASYNISALAYSSGKYDDVEGRLTFASPNVVKRPKWPELVDAGGTPVYSALATVLKGQPNEPFTLDESEALKNYPTIEIKFAQAGFDYLPGTATVGDKEVLAIDPNSANPKAIRYLICVKRDSSTDGAGFKTGQTFAGVFANGASMNYLEITTDDFKDSYAPHQFKYIDGHTTTNIAGDGNPYLVTPTADRPEALLNEFAFEFLATSDTSFWVAIFAVNNNIVSEKAFIGLVPGSNAVLPTDSPLIDNQIKATSIFSTVGFVTIQALSSNDVDPSPDTEIVELKTTEPSFNWTVGDERPVYDDLGNRLFIPSPYTSYRITIRENVDKATSFDPIFIELTGYHSPSSTPNFTFLRDYNDPNMIESLVGNLEASGYKLNDDSPPKMEWISTQSTAERSKAEWFKVETSGVIFKNSPENFPIRDFELLVEAHDSDGATSAGNQVWDNTIGAQGTESYVGLTNDRGWDIFAGKLAVPSGIVFATTRLDTTLIGNDGFLLPQQAYNRNYPYLATAAVYADGTLNLRMEESKAQNGDVILNSNQIRDSFSEVAGLVYYFTTGDSTLLDTVNNGVVTFNHTNISPSFTIDTNNIADSIALGNMTIRKKLPYRNYNEDIPPVSPSSSQLDFGIRNSSLVADTGASEKEILAADFNPLTDYTKGELVVYGGYIWKALQDVAASATVPIAGANWFGYWQTINVSAFRNFALLEGQDPSNFTIPFPAIGDPLVTNIDLSIALFDKLALARYFESDGTTPKRETVTTLNGGQAGQRIPLIFTDKTLNLSMMPDKILDTKDEAGIDDDINWAEDLKFTTPGDSIHLKELSVLSQKDGAGSYKSWFDFEIQPETDFDQDGQYVGPRYAFNPDEGDTEFLHRGFKSKNIKNITLELSEDYKYDPLAPYWFKPPATEFVGIDNLKIPEFAYLKVEFNEPIDPTKYWLNVDYNQTAGGHQHHETVKVSNSGGKDINPNIFDYVMPESNPEPNCFVEEKNEKFARFFIGPFFSAAKEDINVIAAPTMGKYVQLVLYRFSSFQSKAPCMDTIYGDTSYAVTNATSFYQGGAIYYDETYDFHTAAANKYSIQKNVQGNPYDGDWSGGIVLKQGSAVDNLHIEVWYQLSWVNENGVQVWWQNGWFLNGLYFNYGYPKRNPLATAPNFYTLTWYRTADNTQNQGSIRILGSPVHEGDIVKDYSGYVFNSTPALEDYAFEINRQAGEQKDRLIHNIRIQGGLMISDEYSAPVLP